MPKLQIKNHQTGAVIYNGTFQNARACIEQAIKDNVCLDYADLSYANLQNISLDDAVMRHARLDYCNLNGANMSETILDGASLMNATLQAACFCFSSMRNANFDGAQFGGTDIAGAAIDKGRFSGLSALSLNFIDADSLHNCIYRSASGIPCPFSAPPLVIGGLRVPVVFFDRHLMIGRDIKTINDWLEHTNDNMPCDYPRMDNFFGHLRQNMTVFHALRENQPRLSKEMATARPLQSSKT